MRNYTWDESWPAWKQELTEYSTYDRSDIDSDLKSGYKKGASMGYQEGVTYYGYGRNPYGAVKHVGYDDKGYLGLNKNWDWNIDTDVKTFDAALEFDKQVEASSWIRPSHWSKTSHIKNETKKAKKEQKILDKFQKRLGSDFGNEFESGPWKGKTYTEALGTVGLDAAKLRTTWYKARNTATDSWHDPSDYPFWRDDTPGWKDKSMNVQTGNYVQATHQDQEKHDKKKAWAIPTAVEIIDFSAYTQDTTMKAALQAAIASDNEGKSNYGAKQPASGRIKFRDVGDILAAYAWLNDNTKFGEKPEDIDELDNDSDITTDISTEIGDIEVDTFKPDKGDVIDGIDIEKPLGLGGSYVPTVTTDEDTGTFVPDIKDGRGSSTIDTSKLNSALLNDVHEDVIENTPAGKALKEATTLTKKGTDNLITDTIADVLDPSSGGLDIARPDAEINEQLDIINSLGLGTTTSAAENVWDTETASSLNALGFTDVSSKQFTDALVDTGGVSEGQKGVLDVIETQQENKQTPIDWGFLDTSKDTGTTTTTPGTTGTTTTVTGTTTDPTTGEKIPGIDPDPGPDKLLSDEQVSQVTEAATSKGLSTEDVNDLITKALESKDDDALSTLTSSIDNLITAQSKDPQWLRAFQDQQSGVTAGLDAIAEAQKNNNELMIQDAERARVAASISNQGAPINPKVGGVAIKRSDAYDQGLTIRGTRGTFGRKGKRISNLNI